MSDAFINDFAGLLVITSFLVVISRKVQSAALLYAIQSLVLVGLFVAIAHRYGAEELYSWSITAFITKVGLVPAILFIFLRKMRDTNAEKPLIPPVWSGLIVAIICVVGWYVVKPIQLPMVQPLKPILAISLAHFFIGLLCIVSQRNILKQIFGYCLMENGSSLTLALLAHRAPHLVEIGITIDAIFAVIVMVILARLIFAKLRTLDVKQLTVLKG